MVRVKWPTVKGDGAQREEGRRGTSRAATRLEWFLTPFLLEYAQRPARDLWWTGSCAGRALHSAPVAMRKAPVIRSFYQRLCQAGKAKKLALMACMRKLLTMLNAMLKNGTPWRHDAESVCAEV